MRGADSVGSRGFFTFAPTWFLEYEYFISSALDIAKHVCVHKYFGDIYTGSGIYTRIQ